MNSYIKIKIDDISAAQSEILIAELSELNFDAFEENENHLSAYVKEENFDEDELLKILNTQKNITYVKSIIEETNWNAKWESEFESIIIDDFVAIRAAFHKPINNIKHEIIITPKMSFGTGHHPTTYLMLQQMQHIDFRNKTVLDFGTGTGILAIMAKKLGAEKIIAIDNEEWSINNAKENLIANGCTDVLLLHTDNLNNLGTFDIIIANINLNVIIHSIESFRVLSGESSQFLLSGFLKADVETLLNNFTPEGYTHKNTITKNEWVSMLLNKS